MSKNKKMSSPRNSDDTKAPPGTGSNPPAGFKYSNTHTTIKRRKCDGDDNGCISNRVEKVTNETTVPVSWWFLPESAKAFQNMDVLSDDIVVSSGIKMGTTWVTKLLNALLFEFDEEGRPLSKHDDEVHHIPNRMGQTYPESTFLSRELKTSDPDKIFERVPNGRIGHEKTFGDFVFEDLVNQPRPRLFPTHLFGRMFLPEQLFDGWEEENHVPNVEMKDDVANENNGNQCGGGKVNKGRGRLIVILRNPKDTLTSLHHFRGVPTDGWDGNEHGPGSFKRFLMLDDCPNAMGNAFYWMKGAAEAVVDINHGIVDDLHVDGDSASDAPRALVIYYESLIRDFPSQLHRVNAFLGLPPLNPAKESAIIHSCHIDTMKSIPGRFKNQARIGGIGKWKKYPDEERWNEFDRVFNCVFGHSGDGLSDDGSEEKVMEIIDPLRFHMFHRIQGLPPLLLQNCTLDTDPREWDPYWIVKMREGMVVPDRYFLRQPKDTDTLGDGDDTFETEYNTQYPVTQFNFDNYSTSVAIKSEMPPNPSNFPCIPLDDANELDKKSPRYHLFVAASCPQSSSVVAARSLLGLDKCISIDVADGQSGAGWVFLNGATCAPWNNEETSSEIDCSDCADISESFDSNDNESSFYLYQVYHESDPLCTSSISVPVLWDTMTNKIVSNDAWEIMKLLSNSASKVDKPMEVEQCKSVMAVDNRTNHLTLFPSTEKLDQMHMELSLSLLNEIDKTGLEYLKNNQKNTARTRKSKQAMFAKLKELEEVLKKDRFLLGNHLSALDLMLAMILYRWDAAFVDAYGFRSCDEYEGGIFVSEDGNANDGEKGCYPFLQAFARDIFHLLQSVNSSAIRLESFRHYFQIAPSIYFTRRTYSAKEADQLRYSVVNEKKLPDLYQILASLQMQAGKRPLNDTSKSPPPKPFRPQMKKFKGISVPPFFNHDSAKLFRNLSLEPTDIILSSGVKMGTTWVTKILNSILFDFDNQGHHTKEHMRDDIPNRRGQTYPDALFPDRETKEREEEEFMKLCPGRRPFSADFGDFIFEDLVNQPRPRLFSSHLFRKDMIPRELIDGWCEGEDESEDFNHAQCSINSIKSTKKGHGRFIVVVRNLKDTLASLHFFRGVPKDGWDGNEHGPGSFRRFVDLETCPNAYGDSFHWIQGAAEAVEAVNASGDGRALVIYYEALKTNFVAQLRRICNFLNLPPLTEAKERAITYECSFESMSGGNGSNGSDGEPKQKKVRIPSLRKGLIGDWVNYLDDQRWSELDQVFNKTLTGVAIAEPLRFYQFKEVPGIPLASFNKQQNFSFDSDPREWPPYLLVILQDGMIVPDRSFLQGGEKGLNAKKNALISQFTHCSYSSDPFLQLNDKNSDGSPRYHLFTAGMCPNAASVMAARTILGLEKEISMDVSDGQSGAGWIFSSGVSCAPWNNDHDDGPFWLYNVYQKADPYCTCDITIPVLWDTATNTIVSNDSFEIIKLLSDSASLGFSNCPDAVLQVIAVEGGGGSGSGGGGGERFPTLFPKQFSNNIERANLEIISPLIDGTENTGLAYLKNDGRESPDLTKGQHGIFSKLDELEKLLENQTFLVGACLTVVDIYLAMYLLRFDAAYVDAFGLRNCVDFKGCIVTSDSYPNLKSFTSRMYKLLKSSVSFESYLQYFRICQAIEFTRQSYSCELPEKQASRVGSEVILPDLKKIVEFLEKDI